MFCQRVLLVLCCCLPGAVAAAPTTEFTLSNGLKVVVREDHRANVVVVQVWYRVGASFERDGETGLSHALEHMMFKRTHNLGSGEFSRRIAERGGRDNAVTTADYTVYYHQWAASNLEESFRLEAERMRNLELDLTEFENERKVILEERRMRIEDEPLALASETFQATAWQSSPYRQPVIGWAADIAHLGLEDLRRWYQRWYSPANAVLVVVGDVNPASVRALAESHFGPLQAPAVAPPAARPEVPQRGEKRITINNPLVTVPSLMLGYKVPVLTGVGQPGPDAQPVAEEDIYALDVLSSVLDAGASARLASRLVRGQELAVSANASYPGLSRLEDLFILDATPREGVPLAKLEAALLQELEALKQTPPTATELARVKTQMKAARVFERDAMATQAMLLGAPEALGLSWRVADRYQEGLDGVTPQAVQRVARRYFDKSRRTVAWLLPADSH